MILGKDCILRIGCGRCEIPGVLSSDSVLLLGVCVGRRRGHLGTSVWLGTGTCSAPIRAETAVGNLSLSISGGFFPRSAAKAGRRSRLMGGVEVSKQSKQLAVWLGDHHKPADVQTLRCVCVCVLVCLYDLIDPCTIYKLLAAITRQEALSIRPRWF